MKQRRNKLYAPELVLRNIQCKLLLRENTREATYLFLGLEKSDRVLLCSEKQRQTEKNYLRHSRS